MRTEDRSVSISDLPWWLLAAMLVLTALPLIVYAGLRGSDALLRPGVASLVWIGAFIVLHEGTHAAAWKLASGLPWSTFRFGIVWKALSPYCHSVKPMPVSAYRIGSLAPLFVTGIIPWMAAIAVSDADLAIASAILIGAAVGDLFVLYQLWDVPDEALVQDHDARVGCIVMYPGSDGDSA